MCFTHMQTSFQVDVITQEHWQIQTQAQRHLFFFLSFVRLVGSVYFTKNKKWFTKATPEGHFNSTVKLGNSPLQNHLEWLDATYSNEDLGENSIFGKRTAIRKCSSISLEQVRMGTGHVETITPECC